MIVTVDLAKPIVLSGPNAGTGRTTMMVEVRSVAASATLRGVDLVGSGPRLRRRDASRSNVRGSILIGVRDIPEEAWFALCDLLLSRIASRRESLRELDHLVRRVREQSR